MFAVIMGFWWVIFGGDYAKPYYPCGDGAQAVYRDGQTGPPGCASSTGGSTAPTTRGGSGGEAN